MPINCDTLTLITKTASLNVQLITSLMKYIVTVTLNLL